MNLTVSGAIVGTVDYMSPEQAYDPRMADNRSDIYSLGCTLHYLLTGKAPYGGKTFMERLLGHREQPIPALRNRRSDVPEALDSVFCRMIAKSPARRPQSMSVLIAELESCHATQVGRTSQSRLESRSIDEFRETDRSIYTMADLPLATNPARSEARTNVFVRSPGSSDNLKEGAWILNRRRRRRLFRGLILLAAALVLGWLVVRRNR
jgi:serine/threonine protein kinase